MTVIPATISNNVPGTDFSLGADTALNEIADVSSIDPYVDVSRMHSTYLTVLHSDLMHTLTRHTHSLLI